MAAKPNSLQDRLLRDIAEIQTKPYPNIALNVQDDDITTACLILTVEGYGHMHLTVHFPHDYPLNPPRIKMDSEIRHPNIFGSYICSSILNTTEGYTSAYTLKSIAIQLLSFFSSDRVEQTGGGSFVDLATYKSIQRYVSDTFKCKKCEFGSVHFSPESLVIGRPVSSRAATITPQVPELQDTNLWPTLQESASTFASSSSQSKLPGQSPILGRNARRRKAKENAEARHRAEALAAQAPPTPDVTDSSGSSVVEMDLVEVVVPRNVVDMRLPNEVLVAICDQLDTEDLMLFAQSWAKIPRVMRAFDLIRTRELQCFCLKEDYLTVKLGVGVRVDMSTKTRSIESEFDLLSDEGFRTHQIRRSTQGRPFEHWLPLPISRGHWLKVADDVPQSLAGLAASANIQNPTAAKVIFHFMNDIVVKLNQQASQSQIPRSYYQLETIQSSLTHASEKAIESYFHLFHLLLCLASANPAIVRTADSMLTSFMNGKTSKVDCPNLGHLLVASLISSNPLTEAGLKAIIKETITRNVVWTLTSNPELAYFEPSTTSEYRLHHSFQASKTSYRLLMFLNLFRKVAVGSPLKPLAQLRDEAFERHGAPPRGSAAGLAAGIKRIHAVDAFPDFLAAMDVKTMPSKEIFNTYLKKCIRESEDKGYSSMPVSQGEALTVRLGKEPRVAIVVGVNPEPITVAKIGTVVVRLGGEGVKSFFPQNRGGFHGHGRGRGGRGGRGGY